MSAEILSKEEVANLGPGTWRIEPAFEIHRIEQITGAQPSGRSLVVEEFFYVIDLT